jgi:hypothetical protein
MEDSSWVVPSLVRVLLCIVADFAALIAAVSITSLVSLEVVWRRALSALHN